MKVVHINGGGETGGGKSYLVTILPELRQAGINAELVVFSEGMLSEEARALGLPLHCLGVSRMMSLDLFTRLYRLLKTMKPDIVHTHGGRANLYGRLAARLAGVPRIITTVHSHADLDYATALHNLWFSTVDRLTWFLADHFIAVSGELGQSLRRRGVPARKVTVIHNGITEAPDEGIDLRTEFGIARGPVICAIGRHVPVKRFDVLIRAMANVVTIVPDATLLFVGEGPLEGENRQLVERLRLGPHVHFAGYRRDARKVLKSADLFVMSSDMEGLPIVLLEALSARVPVVATAVGGIPEVIIHGENGLLVRQGEPEELSQAIVACLLDPEAARQRAKAGRRWFEQHATGIAMALKTAEVYHSREVQ